MPPFAALIRSAARRVPGVHTVLTLRRSRAAPGAGAPPAAVPHGATPARHNTARSRQGRGCLVGEAVAAVIARHPLRRRGRRRPCCSRLRAAAGGWRIAGRRSRRERRAAHRARAGNLLSLRPVLRRRRGCVRARPARASINLKQHRGGAHSIEGRGALAAYDLNEDRLTLWSSTQLAHEVRAFLMCCSKLDENQLRVVAPDVGGGFGAKFVMYPEEVTLAAACLLPAATDQMGRGPARAFSRRRPGARPVLGSRGRLRR